MNSAKPPRLAAWILLHFGPQVNSDALAGDLWEAFQQGRSKAWYWRQVLAAVRWRRLLYLLLLSALVAWCMMWTVDGSRPTLVVRPLAMAALTATYFASLFVPGMMRRRLRVLLALLITAIYGLLRWYQRDLAEHYWMFFWFVASNCVLYSNRHAPAPYHLSLRELVLGDPFAEKRRMMAKLEQSMADETEPEARLAYAEAIAALNRELPATKAAE
jgi:hypothetical protein